jgi:hypothetical protein
LEIGLTNLLAIPNPRLTNDLNTGVNALIIINEEITIDPDPITQHFKLIK